MNASNFDHILRKVLVVPVVALLLAALVLAWQIRVANNTVDQIQLDDTRIAQTLLIEKLILDEETGLRGYEITHDPRFLNRFLIARGALPEAFDKRRAMATNQRRQDALVALRRAHKAWEDEFASPVIATIQAGGKTDAIGLNLQGKVIMDNIRQRADDFNQVTANARVQTVDRWHRQVRTMIVVLVSGAILIGLTIGLYVRRLLHQVSAAFRESNHVLRIQAEQTFRSEERLHTTLRSIGDGVITCDAEGRVLSLNDTAQELTGWTESEAREQPIEQIFTVADESTGEPLENPVARVTRSDTLVRMQNHTILRRRDATEILIEHSGSPIRDRHGCLIGVVLVFRDVTQTRQQQAALLASEKLAVAGRLAASIAHEIHNPLDSVSNLLFLMDGVATPEERDEFLRLAKQEIDRVTQISRAMLSLYRESKAPVDIDVREMLESILLLMDTRFRTLGVDVEHDVPAGLSVKGFPAELRQVFTNLLTNAAEASGRGGLIRLTGEAAHGGAVISIADNGPGVPETIRDLLFQPFFTTKGERGTGLGLWISQEIITKHGGSIGLESSTAQDDHGTTLNIFLATHAGLAAPISPVPRA